MEQLNVLTDDEYYSGHQTGFSFEESESIRQSESSELSSIRQNEDSIHYELLQYDGLNEVAENTESSCSSSSRQAEIKQVLKTNKSVANPLDIFSKDRHGQTSTTSEAVYAMISGLDMNLTVFKAKEDKLELLKSAVETHDGNSILKVVLFLKSTLKKSIFQRELVKYPDAVNTYLSYLEEEHETDELANMLLLLDKPEEAAVFKYEAAVSVQNPERKFKCIENCINTHFQPGVVSSFLRESVLEHKTCFTEHITLKEHQVTSNIEEEHANTLFQELTGRKSFTGSSALSSLVYSCLNFYKVPSIAPISPDSVRNHYKLSSKQFTWCALRVLATQKRWTDIPDLFLTKTWHGGTKFRSSVAMTQVLTVLAKGNAPDEVMEKFISFIDKQELRLVCAKKYKCHSIVLEILKKTKDWEGLRHYRVNLDQNSPEFSFATAALQQSGVNWRN